MSGSNSRFAAFLRPPAIPELDASKGLPTCILLETRVYLARRDDSTTAEGQTSKGHTIQVSICFADPPAVSYVCVHCPKLTGDNFTGEPSVLRSENQFLLLHLPLTFGPRCTIFEEQLDEYYMYKAGPGKPMLHRIPDPVLGLFQPNDVGLYCCDAGEYILAALCQAHTDGGYELHTYSSKSAVWTRKPARLENALMNWEHLPASTHKVMPLVGGLLGWVDLWKGIVACDVLHEDPVVYFIPLPKLMPGNTSDDVCPWRIRDVTCSNGSLKFIEIENFFIRAADASAAYHPDTLYDSDLLPRHDDLDLEPWVRNLVGWRAIIWNRVLFAECWRKECEAHVHDILVEKPSDSALLAGLGDDSVGKSTLMNLLPAFPTLSIHGDDVVYMNCLVRLDIQKAWMIAVDMRKKTLKTLAKYPAAEPDSNCPHFPCVLSSHLNNTPALLQIVQTSNSENVTEN